MRTPEFNISTKKVGAGHFEVTVIDSANDEIKTYIESNMSIIDALNDTDISDINEEVEGTGYSQWEAMQIVIRKSGFDN